VSGFPVPSRTREIRKLRRSGKADVNMVLLFSALITPIDKNGTHNPN